MKIIIWKLSCLFEPLDTASWDSPLKKKWLVEILNGNDCRKWLCVNASIPRVVFWKKEKNCAFQKCIMRRWRQIQKDVTLSLNPVDSCRLNLKDDTKSMDPDQFHSVDCWPDYWFLHYIKFGFTGTERLIHRTVQSSNKLPTQKICEQCVSLNNDLSSIPYPPPKKY